MISKIPRSSEGSQELVFVDETSVVVLGGGAGDHSSEEDVEVAVAVLGGVAVDDPGALDVEGALVVLGDVTVDRPGNVDELSPRTRRDLRGRFRLPRPTGR